METSALLGSSLSFSSLGMICCSATQYGLRAEEMYWNLEEWGLDVVRGSGCPGRWRETSRTEERAIWALIWNFKTGEQRRGTATQESILSFQNNVPKRSNENCADVPSVSRPGPRVSSSLLRKFPRELLTSSSCQYLVLSRWTKSLVPLRLVGGRGCRGKDSIDVPLNMQPQMRFFSFFLEKS